MIYFCLFRNINYVTIRMTTLSKSGKNTQTIKNDLEMDFMILHKWFHENHMILNPGKCHYIVIGGDEPTRKIILNNNEIASSNEDKRLGILLDGKLNFDSHSLCKKAGQNKSLPHSRSEIIAIKLSSKIPIQTFPTDLDVYFSIFKQCVKHHSHKTPTLITSSLLIEY